jgi:hypothetical protein
MAGDFHIVEQLLRGVLVFDLGNVACYELGQLLVVMLALPLA